MSATVETLIWLALKSQVESLPLGFPIAWPGMVFNPPYNQDSLEPYIRSGRVTANPTRELIGNNKPHVRTGVLILTLVHPLGPDTSVLDEYSGTIASHFKEGTNMRRGGVCVTVTNYPHVVEGYQEDGYFSIPIRIPWRSFA